MATKAEHHEAVRAFVKKLTPPLKLSLAALETLAVIAYKQPVTAPEIMEIRGVQGAGVLKTLLDRKLITPKPAARMWWAARSSTRPRKSSWSSSDSRI